MPYGGEQCRHCRSAPVEAGRFAQPGGHENMSRLGCLINQVCRCTLLAITAFVGGAVDPVTGQEVPKPAEPSVKARNHAVLSTLPFANRDDFQDAARGFIATMPDALVTGSKGNVVWSQKDYAFLEKEAPDTVNPSLWRQAQLNHQHGLFKVVDGLYQIRGFDISNMTVLEGDTGLIVIDPQLSIETAKAALDLYYRHRPRRPVVAIIYTHSHADHWGGVKGITNEVDVASGKVVVIAPEGFTEHAVSEDIIVGNAMRRRSLYQFGPLLPKGERGQVDAGLGKTISLGTLSLISPTDFIRKSGEKRTIDGVEIIFAMAPGSEAPAELYMYYPRLKVLNMAEVATHNFHNLLPFRGSEVRDALAWSNYLSEALNAFGDKAEVMIAQHHWPVFGRERVRKFLAKQRNLYKYEHDQTLRLLNEGFTAPEIAERLQLPASLANEWEDRDYYGTVRHNAKAIYQRYLGWYDGNPANLDPLPPVETAVRTIAYMGGVNAAFFRATADYEAGNYRWVAQVMNFAVVAVPGHAESRALLANAYEQLGYQAEAATWRNAYLYAAQELREGKRKLPPRAMLAPDLVAGLPTLLLFDYLAIRLNPARAANRSLLMNWRLTDRDGLFHLTLRNCVLASRAGDSGEADVELRCSRSVLENLVLGVTSVTDAEAQGALHVAGNRDGVLGLFDCLDGFPLMFDILGSPAET